MDIQAKRDSNKKSVSKYQKTRDAIMLRPSKEDGEIIRNAAQSAGQSVQAYILQAVRDRMERDNTAARGFGNSDAIPAEE